MTIDGWMHQSPAGAGAPVVLPVAAVSPGVATPVGAVVPVITVLATGAAVPTENITHKKNNGTIKEGRAYFFDGPGCESIGSDYDQPSNHYIQEFPGNGRYM